MTKRSDQEIALGRRSARVSRIDRLVIAAEMLENPLDPGDAATRAEQPAPRSRRNSEARRLAITRSRPPQLRQVSMSIQASAATPSEHPLGVSPAATPNSKISMEQVSNTRSGSRCTSQAR
jgi:hypothetical protein